MRTLAAAVIACGLAGSAAQAQEAAPSAAPASAVELASVPESTAQPAVAPAAAPAAPDVRPLSAAAGTREREGWYLGFGLGGGGGAIRIAGERHAFDDLLGRSGTTLAMNVRVGKTVTSRLLVGFDGGALAARASGPDEAFQLNSYDVGAMFFPWERGAFARVAAGRSILVVESDGPVLAGKGSYAGWNAIGGVGYAFWLGKTFNLTLNLDYQAHSFSDAGPIDVTGAGGWSAWVGFDWY
jgi:hypothetical protein